MGTWWLLHTFVFVGAWWSLRVVISFVVCDVVMGVHCCLCPWVLMEVIVVGGHHHLLLLWLVVVGGGRCCVCRWWW